MKTPLKEVEGNCYIPLKSRMLSFKEFCQYVYEPLQTIKALNLPEEQRCELTSIIKKRLNERH